MPCDGALKTMTYVPGDLFFLDESGDAGQFGKVGASEYFVVGGIGFSDRKAAEEAARIVKKFSNGKELKHSHMKKGERQDFFVGEIHAWVKGGGVKGLEKFLKEKGYAK
jgi:hypothetical protein